MNLQQSLAHLEQVQRDQRRIQQQLADLPKLKSTKDLLFLLNRMGTIDPYRGLLARALGQLGPATPRVVLSHKDLAVPASWLVGYADLKPYIENIDPLLGWLVLRGPVPDQPTILEFTPLDEQFQAVLRDYQHLVRITPDDAAMALILDYVS